MKIDMHTHCLPASHCAHHQPEDIPLMFQSKGIDAIVLTNHYYPSHCNLLSDNLKEQSEIYLEVFHRCRDAADMIGLKVFFGAEVKLLREPSAPEYLLYGISEEDFLRSFPLYNMSLKELFIFCNEKNILLVQAHPYRTKSSFSNEDMQYVHGIEVYNSHPHNDPRLLDTYHLALRHSKCMTAGSDFHHTSQAGSAGMIVPDYICDQFELRDYILKGKNCIFDSNGIIIA